MDLVHVSEDRWTVVLTFKENNKDGECRGAKRGRIFWRHVLSSWG